MATIRMTIPMTMIEWIVIAVFVLALIGCACISHYEQKNTRYGCAHTMVCAKKNAKRHA